MADRIETDGVTDRERDQFTRSFVKRDQFTVLPIPEKVIKMLGAMAAKDGITRERNKPVRGERKHRRCRSADSTG